jgi:N-acyl-D-aspartate/D-glutamate deacylase
VNVFDAAKVAEHHPEMVHDLPGGARRFNQRSSGYLATLVNGQINVLNGEHTGLRAGQVLRHRQYATGLWRHRPWHHRP